MGEVVYKKPDSYERKFIYLENYFKKLSKHIFTDGEKFYRVKIIDFEAFIFKDFHIALEDVETGKTTPLTFFELPYLCLRFDNPVKICRDKLKKYFKGMINVRLKRKEFV